MSTEREEVGQCAQTPSAEKVVPATRYLEPECREFQNKLDSEYSGKNHVHII
jgi:hypothetical protein